LKVYAPSVDVVWATERVDEGDCEVDCLFMESGGIVYEEVYI
jgi:hypothetical protein